MYSTLVLLESIKKKVKPFHSGGSCIFNIPDHEGRVIWQLTNTCNYSCSYCVFSSGPFKSHGELSTDDMYSVLNQLVQANFRQIKFTGGEPTMRRDLFLILSYASHLGIQFDLSTNAANIDLKKAQKLSALRLQKVHVSVDGHRKELHDPLRGSGTFDRTLRGLKALISEGVRVRVGCVVSSYNEYHIEKMVRWCAVLGVDEVIFSKLIPAGRIRGNTDIVMTRSEPTVVEEIENISLQYRSSIRVSHAFQNGHLGMTHQQCAGGKRFLFIDHKGHVGACPWAAEHSNEHMSKETLTQRSLKDLLQDERIQRFIAQSSAISGCPLTVRGKSI